MTFPLDAMVLLNKTRWRKPYRRCAITLKNMKRGSLKRNKRINRVSDRHKKELDEYSKKRKEYFMLHHFCEVCNEPACDIHHKARRGKNLNNQDTWMAVCRKCHNKIESNGKWARENGYLV